MPSPVRKGTVEEASLPFLILSLIFFLFFVTAFGLMMLSDGLFVTH